MSDEKIRLLNTTPDIMLQEDEHEICIVTIEKGINADKAVAPEKHGDDPRGYMIRGGDHLNNWKKVMKEILQHDDEDLGRYLREIERFGTMNLIVDCKTANKLCERGIKVKAIHTMTVTTSENQPKQSKQKDMGERLPRTDPPPPPPKKPETKVEENIQESIQHLLGIGDYNNVRKLTDFLSEYCPEKAKRGRSR